VFPAAGCQTVVAACALPHATSRHSAIVQSFMTLLRVGARQGCAIKTGNRMLHAASGLPQPLPWISSGKRVNVIIDRSHADLDKPFKNRGDSLERNDGFRRL
jgi:hypothetical protein